MVYSCSEVGAAGWLGGLFGVVLSAVLVFGIDGY